MLDLAERSSLAQRRGGPRSRCRPMRLAKPGCEAREIRQLEAGETFEGLYRVKEVIHEDGCGHGKVVRASCAKTGKDVVVKVRRRKFAPGEEGEWRRMVTRILNLEAHDNVVSLIEALEDQSHYYTVMDACNGCELFDFLCSASAVSERECKRLVRETLASLEHLHSRGLIHRDVKPENLMFHSDASKPSTKNTIKLIDFDTCKEYTPNSPKARQIAGTAGYIAPEAWLGEYSPSSDLWSVGVILYILMTGDMPFSMEFEGQDLEFARCGGPAARRLCERLGECEVDWTTQPWSRFPQARDLCQRLLAFDPNDRPRSARVALSHPWLKE